VNANQVFTWRLQQEQGVLGRRKRGRPAAVKLLPVQVSREAQELVPRQGDFDRLARSPEDG
jgi:hypothetical protein